MGINMDISFSKNSKYKSNPIIIDGFSGSGKILIAELLKAVNSTEISKWELSYDYIPILYSFGNIEKKAATSTLRTIFDEITYTMSIGRELNLRPKDLQFALRHPKWIKYLKAMLNNAYKDKYIEEELAPNMNIPIIVHMSTFNNSLIEDTFHENIKLIYTFRDPLFILETYSSYIDRIGNDPREFTPKISSKIIDLPWYAYGWEEEYIKINNTEKSILLIERCFNFVSEKIDQLFDKEIYKLIFFENITLNTDEIFLELVDFLGLTYNKEIYKKIKIKNKLPRKTSNIVEGFWKRYTTGNVSRAGDGEVQILERTRKLVNEHYFDKLLKLRENYFSFREKYNFN
tara:strand:+ start:230 stop:1264 length:1035 start_codon:yes stop_codon:yes gene_type:complete